MPEFIESWGEASSEKKNHKNSREYRGFSKQAGWIKEEKGLNIRNRETDRRSWYYGFETGNEFIKNLEANIEKDKY
jgi:hypothetical protein